MMLIYAALLSIPDEVIEAAECDGVTGLSQFWKIQLPLVLPAIGICSILTFVGNFNAFDLVYAAQGAAAGPNYSTDLSGHAAVSDILWLPIAAGRPIDGIGDRGGDVPDHPRRGQHLPVPGADAAAEVSVLMSKAATSLPRTLAMHGALLIYTVIALFPVFVVVINSFKGRRAIFGSPLALPNSETFSLIGYQTVFQRGDFFLYFQNSMIVTIGSLVFVLLFGAMAAFALSEYRFKGNTVMGLYLALGIMIPIRLGTVAILQVMVATGLVNTLTALVLVYTASGLPLSIFILSEFMRTVSDDLKNAGRIDGLSEYKIFFRLVLAAGAAGNGDGGGVHHDPDLERSVVPADPGAGGGDQDGDAGGADVYRAVPDRLERRACRAQPRHHSGAGPLSYFLPPVDPRDYFGCRQMSEKPVRVLVAGLGNMGRSHALAYHNEPGYEIVGLVTRSGKVPEGLEGYPHFTDF